MKRPAQVLAATGFDHIIILTQGQQKPPSRKHGQRADGTSKPIGQLQPGDVVLATDPETGETAAKTVTATIFTEDDKTYVDLAIATEDGTKRITTTDHHPFWSESEQEWLDAGDLKPG